MTQQEATLSTWLEYDPTAEELKDDGRYAELASWVDAQVAQVASPAVIAASGPALDLEAELRVLLAKHGLDEKKAPNMVRVALGDPVEEDEDEDREEEKLEFYLVPKLAECPIASTKKRAGLYGGLFEYNSDCDYCTWGPGMPSWPASSMASARAGKTRTTRGSTRMLNFPHVVFVFSCCL